MLAANDHLNYKKSFRDQDRLTMGSIYALVSHTTSLYHTNPLSRCARKCRISKGFKMIGHPKLYVASTTRTTAAKCKRISGWVPQRCCLPGQHMSGHQCQRAPESTACLALDRGELRILTTTDLIRKSLVSSRFSLLFFVVWCSSSHLFSRVPRISSEFPFLFVIQFHLFSRYLCSTQSLYIFIQCE